MSKKSGENQRTKSVMRLFSLGLYEARSFIVLLSAGETRYGREVAEAAMVPRCRVYDVLESLMEKGLVKREGKARKFRYLSEAPNLIMSMMAERSRIRENEISDFLRRIGN